jgi:hypothetical protein
MRTSIVAASVAASLLALPAFAQFPGLGRKAASAPAPADPSVNKAQAPAMADTTVLPENTEIPAPLPPEEVKARIPLPDGPIQPFLITKEDGPFMVLAYDFRGPEAPRQALALTLELRNKYHLPAFILLPKKFPGRSVIRGVPPQAPAFLLKDDVGFPEIIRTLDEAAVLVGNEKTTKDAYTLLHKVKKLHPECLDGIPSVLPWRQGKGLSRAIITTNPLVAAETLFPKPVDRLLGQMNGGPHTISQCPGRYTLQIAAFNGRSTFDKDDVRFHGVMSAMKSPLASAAEDAEKLAESLARDKEIMKTGYMPYVYHDRFSSRVLIGAFDSPNDPRAQILRDQLLKVAVELNQRRVTDVIITPANNLTDIAAIKSEIRQASLSTETARR